MIKALLLAATYFSCSTSQDIEIEGKLYSYEFSPKEEITLETKESTYKCDYDRPYKMGPGIKTISRYRCGPVVIFDQVLIETCNRSDYSPNPDDFYRSTDYGRKLLRIQHDCMEDGLKMTGGWTKLRDRSGEEWQLDQSFSGKTSSSECSTRDKIDKYTRTYEIEKTGDILRIIKTMTNPVRSIKDKKKPLL